MDLGSILGNKIPLFWYAIPHPLPNCPCYTSRILLCLVCMVERSEYYLWRSLGLESVACTTTGIYYLGEWATLIYLGYYVRRPSVFKKVEFFLMVVWLVFSPAGEISFFPFVQRAGCATASSEIVSFIFLVILWIQFQLQTASSHY